MEKIDIPIDVTMKTKTKVEFKNIMLRKYKNLSDVDIISEEEK